MPNANNFNGAAAGAIVNTQVHRFKKTNGSTKKRNATFTGADVGIVSAAAAFA